MCEHVETWIVSVHSEFSVTRFWRFFRTRLNGMEPATGAVTDRYVQGQGV